jgi:hypothetical protein
MVNAPLMNGVTPASKSGAGKRGRVRAQNQSMLFVPWMNAKHLAHCPPDKSDFGKQACQSPVSRLGSATLTWREGRASSAWQEQSEKLLSCKNSPAEV